MSACRWRSLRNRQDSPPNHNPGGWKRLQSIVDEVTPKRKKTTNHNEDEESIEVENTKQQPVKEVAMKGKGKGKKTRCVAYLYTKTYDLLVYKPHCETHEACFSSI